MSVACVLQAELLNLLRGERKFTLLAPPDDAFNFLGLMMNMHILTREHAMAERGETPASFPDSVLSERNFFKKLLMYHLVEGEVSIRVSRLVHVQMRRSCDALNTPRSC